MIKKIQNKIILVQFIFQSITSNEILLPKNDHPINSVKNYFETARETKFHYGVYFLENESTGTDIEFLKTAYPKIILNKPEWVNLGIQKPNLYYFHLKCSKLEDIFEKMHTTYEWNPRATFFILAQEETPNKILEVAKKYFIQHLFICDEIVCSEVKISWNNFSLRILAAYISPYVFFDKMKNIDGIEVRCLKAIQEKIKFESVFLDHKFKSWGLQLPNGSYTDMFQKLQNYEIDIVLGMWPTNFTHILNFDVSFPYLDDALVWMVPKAQIIPHWKRLAIIFTKEIWLAIGCISLTLPIIWTIGGNLLLGIESPSFTNWKTCILKSISIILNVTLPSYPRTVTLRLMFIIWVYSSLILVTLYQSRLLAILVHPQYEEQISEVGELLESGMKFGANVNVKSLYSLKADWKEKKFHDNIESCDLTLKCPNKTAFEKNYATSKAKLAAKFLILQYYTNADGTPMIYLFESTILSHYINIVFSKGHPIFPEFNKYLTRFYEAGFPLKWKNDIVIEKTREFFNKNLKGPSLTLSLEMIVASFKILVIGYGVASLVFLLEIFHYKFVRRVFKRKQTQKGH